MRGNRDLFIIALVTGGFCASFSICDSSDRVISKETPHKVGGQRLSIADARDRFMKAKAGEQKGAAALDLLRNRTVEELYTLRLDNDNGIALCAAWRSLEIQMAARFLGPDRSASRMQAPRLITSEFLGFVEGRLSVSPPDRWLRNLVGVRFSSAGWPSFPDDIVGLRDEVPSSLIERIEPRRRSLPEATFNLSDPAAQLVILGDNKFAGKQANIHVPSSIQKRLKVAYEQAPRRLSAIATADRAVLAIQDDAFPAGKLICIPHVQSGEGEDIYWETHVDTSWFDTYKGTSIYLEMRIRDGDVFVFYSHSGGIGVEQFSIDKGERKCSFNSLTEMRF